MSVQSRQRRPRTLLIKPFGHINESRKRNKLPNYVGNLPSEAEDNEDEDAIPHASDDGNGQSMEAIHLTSQMDEA